MLSIEAVTHARQEASKSNVPAGGVVGGNRELHRSNYERGMLDLRLQLTRMRGEYLNQMNTQSTLLASCAVAMLNSGELVRLDGEDAEMFTSLTWWWLKLCNYVYTISSVLCLAASLWTIYTAMNLITLGLHSTLNGETAAALVEADQLIESRMAEVRLIFVTALVALAVGCSAMVSAVCDTAVALTCLAIFFFACWHASKSDEGTVRLYERYTGLTVEDRWRGTGSHGISQLKELLLPFGYGGAEGRELLHDKGDAVLEAFAAAVGERKKEASQGFAFLAPQWEGLKQMGATFVGRGEPPKRKLTRSKTRRLHANDRDSSATAIQRQWRSRKEVRVANPKGSVHDGWLLKTASGGGPLERLRAAQTPNGPPTKLASVPAGQPPRFQRWFVLNETTHQLAIYTTPDDHAAGAEPKGRVDDLRLYALTKLTGDDGSTTLALLPRSGLKALEASASVPPQRLPSPHGAAAAALAAHGGAEGKSWYLRAVSEEGTKQWLRWFRRAGAASDLDKLPVVAAPNVGAGALAA